VSDPEPPRSRPDRPLDLWVVGHTNIDHLLHVARLPARDRTVPVVRRQARLGGTAANIARSAASWGVRTGLISRVGPDFPPAFRAALDQEHVDLRGLETVPGVPSSACFITEDGRGGQSTLIDQGPMGDRLHPEVPERLLEDAAWVHLTTGAPEYLLRVKAAARQRGLRVAVDPAQEIHYRWSRRPLERLLDDSEILFGNHHEIDRITTILGLRRWEELVDRVPLIIRTRGPKGAEALSRAGRCAVPGSKPRRIEVVTGAGDAFRGGFYAGWFEGEPLAACLGAGSRSARAWIEGRGPGGPNPMAGSP
jgi:sugar/nucleoside kinase (ribokinase family)